MTDIRIPSDTSKFLKRARSAANKALKELENLPDDASTEVVEWFGRIAREKLSELDQLVQEYVERG